MAQDLISPRATARFVVTLPPGPSRIGDALTKTAGAAFTPLYVDRAGADWATELYLATNAPERILIIRDKTQLSTCGTAKGPLLARVTAVHDYNFLLEGGKSGLGETFHAKIVLADGVAAYIGSANLLRRSREENLECGVLLEGPAVQSINVLVNAVLATFGQNRDSPPSN